MTKQDSNVYMVLRVLTGLFVLFFGLNGLLQFWAPSVEMPEAMTTFVGALMASGFVLPVVNLTFLLVGVLFVINKAVPFGAIVLFALSFPILLTHLFLGTASMLFSVILFVLNLYILWVNRKVYEPLFK